MEAVGPSCMMIEGEWAERIMRKVNNQHSNASPNSASGQRQNCSFSSRIPRMSNLTLVLNQLRQERDRLTAQLERLNTAIAALNGTGNARSSRTMSAAARARIAAAQRARWAKVKSNKVVSIRARRRRKLSAAALANIRAAQKARWAKWRKQQKAA